MTKTPDLSDRLLGLIGIVARYDTEDQLRAAGFALAEGPRRVGDVAVVYSYGAWRRGVIVAIGHVNTRVAFTTRGAIDAAGKAHELAPMWIDYYRAQLDTTPDLSDTAREHCQARIAALESGEDDSYTPKITTKGDKHRNIWVKSPR